MRYLCVIIIQIIQSGTKRKNYEDHQTIGHCAGTAIDSLPHRLPQRQSWRLYAQKENPTDLLFLERHRKRTLPTLGMER
jgi:hypothetical protein